MTEAAWFALAVVMLLVALAIGFVRWGRRDAGASGNGLLAKFVLVSTTVGGLLGAPFWWFDLPPSFAWDLPPVASRMLAAAAFAFGITGVIALERPSNGRTRLYLTLIAVYLIPLALAVLALHLDRFDFAAPVTYGFFAVVIILSLGSVMLLMRGATGQAAVAPSPLVSAWLLVAGIALGLWGLALFAAPATPDYPLVFNWAQDPLSSRLIAAMLVGVATAFLTSRTDDGKARLALWFAAVYGIGVVAACGISAVYAKPVPPLYTAAFGVVAIISLGLLALRSPVRAHGRAAA